MLSLYKEDLKKIEAYHMDTNETQWIDFGVGNQRVLDFDGYEIVKTNDLPSRPAFQLGIRFKMNGNVAIKSNGNTLAESGTLIVIDAKCKLTLKSTSGRHIMDINLYNQDNRRMYINGYYFFSTFITQNDVESLTHILDGETMIVFWNVAGDASAIKQGTYFPIMPFDVSNSLDSENKWPKISYSEFSSNILHRIGLAEKYISEFPLQLPSSIATSGSLPSGICGLLTDLRTLVNSLKSAINTLRNPRSTTDYRQVMDQVKTSVDSIRSYLPGHKQDLGREIFIDTGIIVNIDTPGGDRAAEDIIERIGNILENVYQIASKPAHTKTRPKSGQAQLRFSMNPDSSDSEFVLTLALASAKYLIQKIEVVISH